MTAPSRGPVVYVVAKAPRPGVSKTRLCPPLTPDQAADLARAFLIDTLDLVARSGCTARIICRDAGERSTLEPVADSATVHVQWGAGLGNALETAFRQGLADGFDAVGVLGADSPTLPPWVVEQSFACLDRADVAIGPSEDGGYFLLTARAVYPRLFRDMVWSTSTVAEETIARCRSLGLAVHGLPSWYDVDDAPTLERLRAELRRTPSTGASATRRVIDPWQTAPSHQEPSRAAAAFGGIA